MARQRVRSSREVSIVVDTAKLDEIIKANEGKPTRYIIADGVEYGVFQEFSTASGGQPRKSGGTTGRGKPSLVPAFNKIQFGLPKAIGRAIEAARDPYDILKKAAFDIQRMWAEDVNVDTGAYKSSIHVETE